MADEEKDKGPTDGIPGKEPEPKGKKVICEFCECQIAKDSGDVVRMSEKARKFRDLEDENKKLTDRVNDFLREKGEREAKEKDKTPDGKARDGYSGTERRKKQSLHWGGDRRKAVA